MSSLIFWTRVGNFSLFRSSMNGGFQLGGGTMLPRGAQRREVKREERVQSECGAPANAESFSRLANRQDVLHRVFKLSRARVEHGCLQKLLCKYRRGSEPARANQELSQLTGFASSLLRERFDGMLLLPGGVASGDGVLLGCLSPLRQTDNGQAHRVRQTDRQTENC